MTHPLIGRSPRSHQVYIKRTLDDGGGKCVLEMPTGTGKTVCLLSVTTSFQYHCMQLDAAASGAGAAATPKVRKIVYCTRTVQEMEKAIEELKRVHAYRDAELTRAGLVPPPVRVSCTSPAALPFRICDRTPLTESHASCLHPQFLGVGLSSRRNLCIHDAVAQFEQKDKVDSMCRALTTSWVRQQHRDEQKSADELCPYFEGFDKNGADASLTGIYDLHDLKALGRRETWCPYFLARHLINLANVVIFNYQYMIDPKIASLVSSQVCDATRLTSCCTAIWPILIIKSRGWVEVLIVFSHSVAHSSIRTALSYSMKAII